METELLRPIAEVLLRQYDSEFDASHLSWQDFRGEAKEILAAVLPVHEPLLRESIASEIEKTIGGYPANELTRPKVERGGYLNDWQWAAQIARGEES